MSKSKQEIGQIIRQTLLGPGKLKKRQVCALIFMYVMLVALIVASAYLSSTFAWMMGLFWVVSMAQGIIIALTDNSDRYVWQIVNQFLRRVTKPTKGDKRFGVVICIPLGLAMLFFFAYLISGFGSNFFIELMYGAFFGSIALAVGAYIWRLWDIGRRIKAHRQQEETA